MEQFRHHYIVRHEELPVLRGHHDLAGIVLEYVVFLEDQRGRGAGEVTAEWGEVTGGYRERQCAVV